MTATTEDGIVRFPTVDGQDIVADNIDTIKLERIKTTGPSGEDTFKVTYVQDGESKSPVQVSYYIYCGLRDLEHIRQREINHLADALE